MFIQSRNLTFIFCEKSFSRMEYLKLHQRSHSDANVYMCFDCGNTYTTAALLNRQQRIHTGEKPYKCSQTSHCDKRLSHFGNLKSHEMIHTGEKPYIYSM